jgi:hypothetical protein
MGSLDQVGADQLGGAQHRIHQQQGMLSQVNEVVDGCVRRRAAGPETDRGTSGDGSGFDSLAACPELQLGLPWTAGRTHRDTVTHDTQIKCAAALLAHPAAPILA